MPCTPAFTLTIVICGGPRLLLPQHLLVVPGIPSFLLVYWAYQFGSLEAYLREVTEENLREIVGDEGYRGQIQTQGGLICNIELAKFSSIQSRFLSPSFHLDVS